MTAETCRACESKTKLSKINCPPFQYTTKPDSNQQTEKTGLAHEPKRRTSRVCGIRMEAGHQITGRKRSVNRDFAPENSFFRAREFSIPCEIASRSIAKSFSRQLVKCFSA